VVHSTVAGRFHQRWSAAVVVVVVENWERAGSLGALQELKFATADKSPLAKAGCHYRHDERPPEVLVEEAKREGFCLH
jgi:hypothetical protein